MTPGRNDACPCGSGRKFKKCCLPRGELGITIEPQRHHTELPSQNNLPRQETLTPVDIRQLAALLDSARFEEVEDRARMLLMQHPDSGFAWKALGVSLQAQGKDCLPTLRTTAALLTNDAEAHNNLGIVQRDAGQHGEAAASFRRALWIQPDFAQAHNNLGTVLQTIGQLDEAAASYQQALAHRPDFAIAHSNLGTVQHACGQLDEAVASYHRAIARQPSFAQAHCNLGHVLRDLGQLSEAVASCSKALALDPDFAPAHSNLGDALRSLGQLDAAATSYRRALALRPELPQLHTSLLFCLSHSETVDAQELFAEHRRFAERFEAPLRSQWPQHGNTRDPERRLQVGFVSGDLRSHAVANFIGPVLAQLALQPRLSLHAYYNHALEDDVTQRLKGYFSHWHSVVFMSDDALAQAVIRDGIDILIDLSGHTSHNRLLSFARKPAPIQVTWIGYPNTTGLCAMDYVLCDRFNAPQGLYEMLYVEKFARLPSSGTFAPPSKASAVGKLPALTRGRVTFGSFNRPEKLGAQVLAAWARVLQAVPNSVLLLGNVSDTSLARRLTQCFGELGIAADRLVFRPRVPLDDYLELHHEVDMILDTWPYGGGTTTHYALCMGVPVVTLLGPMRSHCQSAAVLGRSGLHEWVARDVDEFVRIAVRWGHALPALAQLRAGLRERWQDAPLQRPATVAQGLELALQHMWRRWCAGLPAEHFEIEHQAVLREDPGGDSMLKTQEAVIAAAEKLP